MPAYVYCTGKGTDNEEEVEKNNVCPVCKKSFRFKSMLKAHTRFKRGDCRSRLVCRVCRTQFQTYFDYAGHKTRSQCSVASVKIPVSDKLRIVLRRKEQLFAQLVDVENANKLMFAMLALLHRAVEPAAVGGRLIITGTSKTGQDGLGPLDGQGVSSLAAHLREAGLRASYSPQHLTGVLLRGVGGAGPHTRGSTTPAAGSGASTGSFITPLQLLGDGAEGPRGVFADDELSSFRALDNRLGIASKCPRCGQMFTSRKKMLTHLRHKVLCVLHTRIHYEGVRPVFPPVCKWCLTRLNRVNEQNHLNKTCCAGLDPDTLNLRKLSLINAELLTEIQVSLKVNKDLKTMFTRLSELIPLPTTSCGASGSVVPTEASIGPLGE
jgi:hypothetical protein